MDDRRSKEQRPHRLRSIDLPDLRSLGGPHLGIRDAKFQPEAEELPPVKELLDRAEVTEDDARRVAVQWYESSPDRDYDGILNAVEIEEPESG